MLPVTEEKATHIGCARISLIEKDIYYIVYKEDYQVQVEDFEDSFAVYAEYSKEKPLKILVELPPHSTATSDATRFAEKQKHKAIAEAIYIHNLAQRILVRFYILFHKKRHPIKVFTKKESAISWLHSKG